MHYPIITLLLLETRYCQIWSQDEQKATENVLVRIVFSFLQTFSGTAS